MSLVVTGSGNGRLGYGFIAATTSADEYLFVALLLTQALAKCRLQLLGNDIKHFTSARLYRY
jgi:hypothetical protein